METQYSTMMRREEAGIGGLTREGDCSIMDIMWGGATNTKNLLKSMCNYYYGHFVMYIDTKGI